MACGADVVLWDAEELHRAFPHLNVDDIRLASYGRSGEGWFSNTGLMNGFKAKAREQVKAMCEKLIANTVIENYDIELA